MKILLVGSGGHVGGVARAELEKRGHDVIGATRSIDPGVDTSDADSISKLLEAVGVVDAIVVAVGAAAFKPVTELTREDYTEIGRASCRERVESSGDAGAFKKTEKVRLAMW